MFEDFKEKVGKLQNKKDSEIPRMCSALIPFFITGIMTAAERTRYSRRTFMLSSSFFLLPKFLRKLVSMITILA